ncbi:hypothetical protein ACFQYP_65425 [Nonomuraea antimicrobica]
MTACAIAGDQTGLDARVMGDRSAWHRRWRAAREAQQGPPAMPAASASLPAQRPAADKRPPQLPVFISPPPPLSEEEQRLLEIYGRTGVRLLRRSDPGNSQDCMRLAVIACLKGWPEEARTWLHRAGAAGNQAAVDLLHEPGWKETAADHAFRFGQEHQRADRNRPSTAMFFYRLAGDHGHSGAAFHLGVLHRNKGEDWAAASWLRRAAVDGHSLAAIELNGVSEQLTQTSWEDVERMFEELAQPDPPPAAGDSHPRRPPEAALAITISPPPEVSSLAPPPAARTHQQRVYQ